MTIVAGTVYAAVVNNPGAIDITSDADSVLQITGVSGGMGLDDAGGQLFDGTIDSTGATNFDELDMAFDPFSSVDGDLMTPHHFTGQVQATSDGTGKYCPGTGAATISLSARVKFTKVFNVTGRNCLYTIKSSSGGTSFTFTTGTSGALSGSSFLTGTPKMVVSVQIAAPLGYTGTCTMTDIGNLNTQYGLPLVGSSVTGGMTLFGASISPTFTGSGC